MPLVLLSGCSAPGVFKLDNGDYDATDVDDVRNKAIEKGYVEVADVLDDGVVTRSEWHRLHMLQRGCFEDLGMEYDEPLLDPIEGIFYVEDSEWHGSGYGPEAEDADACYFRYQDIVATRFIRDNEPRMDPSLLSATWSCLDERDVPYSGEESKLRDFFPTLAPGDDVLSADVQHGAVAQCVRQEVQQTYPEVHYFEGDFDLYLECGRECWSDQ